MRGRHRNSDLGGVEGGAPDYSLTSPNKSVPVQTPQTLTGILMLNPWMPCLEDNVNTRVLPRSLTLLIASKDRNSDEGLRRRHWRRLWPLEPGARSPLPAVKLCLSDPFIRGSGALVSPGPKLHARDRSVIWAPLCTPGMNGSRPSSAGSSGHLDTRCYLAAP